MEKEGREEREGSWTMAQAQRAKREKWAFSSSISSKVH